LNFFAHSVVACWSSEEPLFILGSMLPDLAAMLGLRLGEVRDPELKAGIDCHIATDAVFHGTAHFVQHCQVCVEDLVHRGVGRGTARAVAHVGFELVLDGWLCQQPSALQGYARALQFSQDSPSAWVDALALSDEQRQRLLHGTAQLTSAPIPQRYRDPLFVADRMEFILRRRPRLAMQPADVPHVQDRMQQLHGVIGDVAPALLSDVRARLLLGT